MYHYTETITNRSGDSLSGYFVRLIDPVTGGVVTLASDDGGTPIITASGVADMAKTDDDGIVSLYVAIGDYHLDIYGQDATTFIKRLSNVPMRFGQTGEQGIQGIPGTATAAATLIATRAALVSGNGAQTIFESQAPTGQTSSGSGGSGEDAVKFRIVTTTGKISDGGIYYDNVVGLGWNIDTAFSPVNALLPACSLRMETKFRQNSGSIFGSEYHLPAHVPVGAPPGTEWRPHSIFTPFNYSDRDSAEYGHSYQGNTYLYSDGELRLRKQIAYASGGGSSETFSAVSGQPYTLNFEFNGTAPLFQRNAAGNALLSLPYYGSDNIIRIGNILGTGILSANNSNGNKAIWDYTASGAVAGSYYLLVAPDTVVTGDQTGLRLSASATGTFYNDLRNYNATGTVMHRLQAPGRGIIIYSDEISKAWSVGVDYSADTYGICAANEDLTSNKALVINRTTLAATFGGTVKLHTYTVSGLPAAATAGAGARAFVSDATTPTFMATVAGSGAVFTPVYSDGTNWKVG